MMGLRVGGLRGRDKGRRNSIRDQKQSPDNPATHLGDCPNTAPLRTDIQVRTVSCPPQAVGYSFFRPQEPRSNSKIGKTEERNEMK